SWSAAAASTSFARRQSISFRRWMSRRTAAIWSGALVGMVRSFRCFVPAAGTPGSPTLIGAAALLLLPPIPFHRRARVIRQQQVTGGTDHLVAMPVRRDAHRRVASSASRRRFGGQVARLNQPVDGRIKPGFDVAGFVNAFAHLRDATDGLMAMVTDARLD